MDETKNYLSILKKYSSFTSFNGKNNNYKFPAKSITNIEKALSYINSNITKPLNLDVVSKAIYISPTYLSRLFKSDLNINFIDYVNILKMNLAQEKLISTKVSIIDLANDLGFAQASYFTKIFKRWTGTTPSEYRQKNTNVKQIYTIFRTPNWTNSMSVLDATKQYLSNYDLPVKTRKIDSNEYIYSIDNLENKDNHNNGWIYTVDCSQPANLSNKVSVCNKSVIQWMYINSSF
nr:helix-turn-helix domain-containing protein [Limosilactobacillus rudii]